MTRVDWLLLLLALLVIAASVVVVVWPYEADRADDWISPTLDHALPDDTTALVASGEQALGHLAGSVRLVPWRGVDIVVPADARALDDAGEDDSPSWLGDRFAVHYGPEPIQSPGEFESMLRSPDSWLLAGVASGTTITRHDLPNGIVVFVGGTEGGDGYALFVYDPTSTGAILIQIFDNRPCDDVLDGPTLDDMLHLQLERLAAR